MAAPTLSLILCSRNDCYMGASTWRLQTTLNALADANQSVLAPGFLEVLVVDWGSEVPLRETLSLTTRAAQLVSFVTVAPDVARPLQRDSPFPEVLALNAAARRARGSFIGRIDQDTIVGPRFLTWARRALSPAAPGTPAGTTAWFANRRSIPYRLAVRCPPRAVVSRFLEWFGAGLRVDTSRPPEPFYQSDVGIWLLHRDRWHALGGYDERMIYMNDMESEMAARVGPGSIVDLGPLVEYDFHHLDHYHPRGSRSSSAHRRVNGGAPAVALGACPSGPGWGLAALALPIGPGTHAIDGTDRSHTITTTLATALVAAVVWIQVALDAVAYRVLAVWWRRAHRLARSLRAQPIARWPTVVRTLLRGRA